MIGKGRTILGTNIILADTNTFYTISLDALYFDFAFRYPDCKFMRIRFLYVILTINIVFFSKDE